MIDFTFSTSEDIKKITVILLKFQSNLSLRNRYEMLWIQPQLGITDNRSLIITKDTHSICNILTFKNVENSILENPTKKSFRHTVQPFAKYFHNTIKSLERNKQIKEENVNNKSSLHFPVLEQKGTAGSYPDSWN